MGTSLKKLALDCRHQTWRKSPAECYVHHTFKKKILTVVHLVICKKSLNHFILEFPGRKSKTFLIYKNNTNMEIRHRKQRSSTSFAKRSVIVVNFANHENRQQYNKGVQKVEIFFQIMILQSYFAAIRIFSAFRFSG